MYERESGRWVDILCKEEFRVGVKILVRRVFVVQGRKVMIVTGILLSRL
jgi:hypothetical protein